MLIAIISDIHDNLVNLKKFLTWSRDQGIEKIIFCGDTTTGDTAAYLAGNFPGEIFVARGNIELYEEKELKPFKNVSYGGEIGIIELDGLNIAFCHEPEKIEQALKIAPRNPDFIFYGHTHKPWLDKRGSTIVANPGNLANIFHQPTFAVLDTATRKLDLKILADL
jgi:hypothetical protein